MSAFSLTEQLIISFLSIKEMMYSSTTSRICSTLVTSQDRTPKTRTLCTTSTIPGNNTSHHNLENANSSSQCTIPTTAPTCLADLGPGSTNAERRQCHHNIGYCRYCRAPQVGPGIAPRSKSPRSCWNDPITVLMLIARRCPAECSLYQDCRVLSKHGRAIGVRKWAY